MKTSVPHLQFHDCAAGWIHFTVVVGDQATEIHASHIHDPFFNMLCWLERIAAGRHRSSFVVDQEGMVTRFAAIRKDAEKVGVLIRDINSDRVVRIRKLVAIRQLIEGFYEDFVQFVKSPRYIEEEWAFISLGDRLATALPQLDRKDLVAELAKLDSNTLRKVFFHVAPSYEITLKGEETTAGEMAQFANLVLHSDNKDMAEGSIETPAEWELPCDFDTWPHNRRTHYLHQFLHEKANSWSGYKLNRLSSPRIERYLLVKDGE